VVVIMDYTIEVIDAWGRRRAWFHEAPLLEAIRRAPDQPSEINGLLPTETGEIGPGCTVRVFTGSALFLEAEVTRTRPQWGDKTKLILDTLVPFHEALEFEATTSPALLNRRVSRAYTNREIAAMVKDVIHAANGPLHYWVDHTAYPDGAQREYAKFLARKTAENELEIGGITAGQWAGGARIDASAAFAKDGDTIAGLVVDGVAWPDLRFLMIDCEETARNAHAHKRHPETEFWTDAEYDASGYKRKGDAAKAFLQDLIDTKGIDYVELNPHRDVTGDYDDRVDFYGRYIGLVYGGGECFNAAMVEQGHADVYLYQEGKFHEPAMDLKDYFSYTAPHTASISASGAILQEYDVAAGALEVLTALAYAANGFVFEVDAAHGVSFYPATAPRKVVYFDPLLMGVRMGRDATDMGNILYFAGNPFLGAVEKTYTRGDSIDEYGVHAKRFEYFSITKPADADRLCAGALEDLAYPAVAGQIVFYRGNADLRVGDLIELRGAPVRRLERELAGEFGGRFSGKLVARATEVAHRFAGARVETRVTLGPPLRSVSLPLSYIVRSQPGATTLFEFRLDDPTVGLDLGFHLD
jgi:endonuclease YncB( thermonuclease family)